MGGGVLCCPWRASNVISNNVTNVISDNVTNLIRANVTNVTNVISDNVTNLVRDNVTGVTNVTKVVVGIAVMLPTKFLLLLKRGVVK